MATDQFDDHSTPAGRPAEPGTSPPVVSGSARRWHPITLLLALPIVLALMTPLFNREDPKLFGFPAFYWLQLAWVFVGVTSTTIVYQMTKDRG